MISTQSQSLEKQDFPFLSDHRRMQPLCWLEYYISPLHTPSDLIKYRFHCRSLIKEGSATWMCMITVQDHKRLAEALKFQKSLRKFHLNAQFPGEVSPNTVQKLSNHIKGLPIIHLGLLINDRLCLLLFNTEILRGWRNAIRSLKKLTYYDGKQNK